MEWPFFPALLSVYFRAWWDHDLVSPAPLSIRIVLMHKYGFVHTAMFER